MMFSKMLSLTFRKERCLLQYQNFTIPKLYMVLKSKHNTVTCTKLLYTGPLLCDHPVKQPLLVVRLVVGLTL